MAQSVARILGKDEVTSSNLVSSSNRLGCSNSFIYKDLGTFIFLTLTSFYALIEFIA